MIIRRDHDIDIVHVLLIKITSGEQLSAQRNYEVAIPFGQVSLLSKIKEPKHFRIYKRSYYSPP